MFIPAVFMNNHFSASLHNPQSSDSQTEQQLEGDGSSPAAYYFRSQCNKLVKNTSYSESSQAPFMSTAIYLWLLKIQMTNEIKVLKI